MKIEGRNAIAELLKTDKNIEKILVDSNAKDGSAIKLIGGIRGRKIKMQIVSKEILDKESESKRHQGFIAYVSDFVYSELQELIDISKNKNSDAFIIILDGIEDPHNLGSIIRVAECGGIDGIIIAKDRQVGVTDTVMRVSEGAANHVKIAKVTNINTAIDKLKENNIFVYGAELGGADIYKSNLKGNIALVIGGEDTGIKRLTKEKCDQIVSVPMYGKVNSLNASVACGIVVFEALRQRN